MIRSLHQKTTNQNLQRHRHMLGMRCTRPRSFNWTPSFTRRSTGRYTPFGGTIIEMLLLISVSSIMLTLVAIWLHKMILFSSTLSERQRDHVSLSHLATDLRQDVMLAKLWSFPNPKEPNHLELVLADNSIIQYRLVFESYGSLIHAMHLPAKLDPAATTPPANSGSGKEASPTKTLARQEVYRFSPGCRLTWEKNEFPQALVLAAYRVPMLANPLPKPASGSNSGANPVEPKPGNAAAVAIQPTSVAQRSSAPVEAVVRLSPNRWASRVNRVLGESP